MTNHKTSKWIKPKHWSAANQYPLSKSAYLERQLCLAGRPAYYPNWNTSPVASFQIGIEIILGEWAKGKKTRQVHRTGPLHYSNRRAPDLEVRPSHFIIYQGRRKWILPGSEEAIYWAANTSFTPKLQTPKEYRRRDH